MDQPALRGIVTPLVTPFTTAGTVDTQQYENHARQCLADGSHFLSPFGTTGEAASVSMDARKHTLEALVEGGAARPDQLLPGTGLTSLDETVDLSRHAVEIGASAVMLLPPFFFKDATDEGLYRYFAQVIERIGDERLRIVLYNIPKFSGVPISAALTRRLALDFPGIIAGYKDSGGQWANTVQIIRAAPEIAVFPGSETMLPQAIATGGAGCISASCNVNAAGIRALYDALISGDTVMAKDRALQVNHVRQALEKNGLIPACKAIIAARTGHDGWLRLLPPLADAPKTFDGELESLI